MKTSRRRLDVDVEELDRVIDAAENGPLSKADRQKLKTTLHALVERLAQKRNTEKTNSVLEQKTHPLRQLSSRNRSRPLRLATGATQPVPLPARKKSAYNTRNSNRATPCPECREGRVYRQKEPKTLIRNRGTGAAESDRVRDGASPLQRLLPGVHRGGASWRRNR